MYIGNYEEQKKNAWQIGRQFFYAAALKRLMVKYFNSRNFNGRNRVMGFIFTHAHFAKNLISRISKFYE